MHRSVVYAALAVLFAFPLPAAAQQSVPQQGSAILPLSPEKRAVVDAATKATQAFAAGDEKAVIYYTYPPALELAGGSDRMIAQMRKTKADMMGQGLRFSSVAIGTPTDIVKAGKQMRVIVPQTMIMTIPGGSIAMDSHSLGISEDEGKTWRFIDTAGLSPQVMQRLFPDYDYQALPIPPRKAPEFKAGKQ